MTQIFLVSGTSFSTPSDWNNAANTVETLAAGGNGFAGISGPQGGGGGGSGGYSSISNLTLSGSITYQIGGIGSPTYFNGASLVLSSVGSNSGASATLGPGGAGGSTTAATGTTKTAGSVGGSGPGASIFSGGGGGGGAPSSAGVGSAGNNGLADSGPGGDGGPGGNASGTGHGNGGASDAAGTAGTNWDASHGSGGGGGGGGTLLFNGKNGGNYGSGGGGGGTDGTTFGTPGSGSPAIIAITYTPASTNTGWFSALSQPSRLSKAFAVALIASGCVLPPFPPRISGVSVTDSDGPTFKKVVLYQATAYGAPPISNAPIPPMGWYLTLGEPVVKIKISLGTANQQAFTTSLQPITAIAPSFGWYASFSEPLVKAKPGLSAANQQALALAPVQTVIPPPSAGGLSASFSAGPTFRKTTIYQGTAYGAPPPTSPYGWYLPQNEPVVKAKSGLSAANQPSFTKDYFPIVTVVTPFGWYAPFSDLPRANSRLPVYQQQFSARDENAPTLNGVAGDSSTGPIFKTSFQYQERTIGILPFNVSSPSLGWYLPLSEPIVKTKVGLTAANQQAAAFNPLPIPPILVTWGWVSPFSEPIIKTKLGLKTASQLAFTTSLQPVANITPSFGWMAPLSLPVRLRPALGAYRDLIWQFVLTAHTTTHYTMRMAGTEADGDVFAGALYTSAPPATALVSIHEIDQNSAGNVSIIES